MAGRLISSLLFLVLAIPLLFAKSQQPDAAPGQPIHVSVNRVNVSVTVMDSEGHFIKGLRQEDFHVFDNGVEQRVTDFLPMEESSQILLLVEAGPAVYFLGRSHFQAANNFLAGIASGDRVAIASYTDAAQPILDFTTDKGAARVALQNLNFVAGFGDLNLSSSIATCLDWLAPVPGKKTIVLLSTGFDTSPPGSRQLIEEKLKTSDVRILAVSLSGNFRKPIARKKLSPQDRADRDLVKQGFLEADQSLRGLSESTGGRVYFPKNSDEFDRAWAEIAQLVRYEYSLAYAPPSRDGQLHSIKIIANHPSYRVDHRQAYLAAK